MKPMPVAQQLDEWLRDLGYAPEEIFFHDSIENYHRAAEKATKQLMFVCVCG